jgi:PIN domain nuclease of toxin-antitoxin system
MVTNNAQAAGRYSRFFWVVVDRSKLSKPAADAMADKANRVYVSVASAWEMSIKVGIGK